MPDANGRLYYWEYGEQDKETRRKYYTGDILVNAVKCLKCGDTIRSNHRHDYKTCSCGNAMVDGGSWYARYGAVDDWNTIEKHTVYYKDVDTAKEIEENESN